MDSGSGSNTRGRDPARKYCILIEGNKNGTICKFCGMVIKVGELLGLNFTYHIQIPTQIAISVLMCLSKLKKSRKY